MKYKGSWKHLGAKILTFSLLLVVQIGNSSASFVDCTNNNEIGSIHQEIGLLRDENKNQNIEISLLKEMIELQDKKIDQKIIEELDKRMKYDESSMTNDHNQHSSGKPRQKRPFRLIPAVSKNIFVENKYKNENSIILNQHQTTTIFYGPPSNCSDLSRLGYTLNGYYLVKQVTDTFNTEVTNLQSIYCSFKQPERPYFNLSTEEKQIEIFNFLDGHIESSETSQEGKFNSNGRDAINRNPPSMENLVNDLGFCAAISWDSSGNGADLIQWDCKPQKGQIWSWNEASLGSGDRHLCNGYGKCIAPRQNSSPRGYFVQCDHRNEKGQRFQFLNSPSRPGFYIIKNDHGKCLSVAEDKKINGEFIRARNCNSSEKGQNWKWNVQDHKHYNPEGFLVFNKHEFKW